MCLLSPPSVVSTNQPQRLHIFLFPPGRTAGPSTIDMSPQPSKLGFLEPLPVEEKCGECGLACTRLSQAVGMWGGSAPCRAVGPLFGKEGRASVRARFCPQLRGKNTGKGTRVRRSRPLHR